jgi:Domain of unknown function (DUF4785)
MRKLLLVTLISAACVANAAPNSMQAISSRNQNLVAPNRLVKLAVPQGVFERKPVSFAYALNPQAELARAEPSTAESREFWMQVDSAQLNKGMMIDTTAPGALIRISPAQGASDVDSSSVTLTRNGKKLAASQAFANIANGEQLQKAGMDVTNGTAIMKIADANGAGRFQLALPKASGRYLVHVFEPNSDVTLQAKANRENFMVGDELVVYASLGKNEKAMANTIMSGLLVSPSGKSYDMTFTQTSTGLRASKKLPSEVVQHAGLWEVQILAGASDSGLQVQRDTRTVISIAQPTAKLSGQYRFDPLRVGFTMPIQVGSPGRYELSGVLFATSKDGVSRPVAQAAMANWFSAGKAALSLNFNRANIPAGYGAPFELKYVELKDQTRLTQLESREFVGRVGRATPIDRNDDRAPIGIRQR